MSLNVPWWVVFIATFYLLWVGIRKYYMRIFLVLVIILGMIAWNKGWFDPQALPANAPVAVQAQEPSMVDSVKQWFVDHTPKK